MAHEEKNWDFKKKKMLEVLCSFCTANAKPLPDMSQWPKTRELADACDVDIYTARLLLLLLEKEGKALCSHRSIRNSFRWFPASETLNK